MTKDQQLNTRARLSITVAILAVFATLLGAWLWILLSGKERALLDARERAAAFVGRGQERFSDAVTSVGLALELADQATAGQDLKTLSTNRQTSRFLSEFQTRIPNLNSLWVLDSQGQLMFGDPGLPAGTPLAESDFFRSHSTGGTVLFVGANVAERGGKTFIPISRRLERSGAFGGVVVSAVDPSWFHRIGTALNLPSGASLSLLTPQGSVVTSTDEAIHSMAPVTRRELVGKALTSGKFDTTTVVLASADGDKDVLIGAQPIKRLNLVVLYAVPYVTALQAWSAQLWLSSALLAAAILIVIAGAILILLYGRRQGDLRRVIGLRTAEAAQAVERLSLAVDTTGIGIFDYRMGSRDIAWAGIETNYFGLRAPPALTPRSMLRVVHPADRPGLMERLRNLKAARNDMRFDTEFRLRHPEFGPIWVAARAKLFIRNGSDKGPGRLIGTLRDITERRRLQEHRETVLREINHRIKNSLQLMNSIMNLQARRITSAEERSRFEAARRRLISLATVYAHLDDTTQPDVVELVPFLRRLCQDFSVAYMADGRINLTFSATGSLPISATLAVPLGMAMGEILVNISLNGFAPQTTGAVMVNVAIAGNECDIAVSHNGRSVSQAFEGDGATLGRLLIDAFVDQLGGTFRTEDRNPGLLFALRFHVPPVTIVRPISPSPG